MKRILPILLLCLAVLTACRKENTTTSYSDPQVFELTGNVKEVYQVLLANCDSLGQETTNSYRLSGAIVFDKEEHLLSNDIIGDGAPASMERDSLGRLIMLRWLSRDAIADSTDLGYGYRFDYSAEGRLERMTSFGFEYNSITTYTYSEDGRLASYRDDSEAEPAFEGHYRYIDFDEQGNWTRRMSSETFDSNPFYVLETREITYF